MCDTSFDHLNFFNLTHDDNLCRSTISHGQDSIMMVKLGFLFHIIVETPASIAFFVKPSATLGQAQLHAHPIIRQYAFLLLASSRIAYAFLYRPTDDISRTIAAALAFYHVLPSYRASCRIASGEGKGVGIRSVMRSPWVHLVAHLLCLVGLLWEMGKNG